jgi:protein CMS1
MGRGGVTVDDKYNRKPLAPNNKTKKKKKQPLQKPTKNQPEPIENTQNLQPPSAAEQLSFFINQFQSANGVQLSSLELESLKGTYHYFGLFVCF